MDINKRIAEIVVERGIKQSFLAEKTGLSNDAISTLLRCKRKMSASEFLNICDVLNIEPNIFLKKYSQETM